MSANEFPGKCCSEINFEKLNADEQKEFTMSRNNDSYNSLTATATATSEYSPSWCKLPSLVLEKIYLFSSKEDQCRMFNVCQSWADAFDSPLLWHSYKLNIPEDDFSREFLPGILCAEKFGKYFRHVEIYCKNVSDLKVEDVLKQFNRFLKVLTSQCQLDSISFVDMKWLYLLSNINSEETIQSIINLLQSQNCLKAAEFTASHFSLKEGLQIFKALSTKNNTTLKKLKFCDFIYELHPRSNENGVAVRAQPNLNTFNNLSEIDISYSQFFENIITVFTEEVESAVVCPNRRPLKRMNIECNGKNFYLRGCSCQGIQPKSWSILKTLCPALDIGLVFLLPIWLYMLDIFIVKSMPIKSLCLNLSAGIGTGVIDILQQLNHCDVSESVEYLLIRNVKVNDEFARDLILFLSLIPNLRGLTLYCQNLSLALGTVFDYFVKTGIGRLESFRVQIPNIRGVEALLEYPELKEYVSMMQNIGLNFQLR